MAYFGKDFTFEREENYDAFINALVKEEEHAKKFASYKPKQRLEKDGDGYKLFLITPENTKEYSFKAGVAVDDTIREGLVAKTTFTVDGNTVIQVQEFADGGQVVFKREYSDNGLKVTATTTKWDGEAYRWYTAA